MDTNYYGWVVSGEAKLIDAAGTRVLIRWIDVNKGIINKLIYPDLPTREAHSKVVTSMTECKINKNVAGVVI